MTAEAIATTARQYATILADTQAQRISPDACRKLTAMLKEGVSENDWQRIKVRAIHGMTGGRLN